MSYISRFPILRRIGAIGRLARRAYQPYLPQIATLTFLGFIGGILEGIGINTVIPLLTFIMQGDAQATDIVSTTLRSFFEFAHIDFAPKFLLVFIVLLFMARGVVVFFLTYLQIRISSDYELKTRAHLLDVFFRTPWSQLLKQRLGHLEVVLMVDVPASVNLLKKLSIVITLFTGLVVYIFIALNISFSITVVTLFLGLLIFVLSKPILYRLRLLGAARVDINKETTHHVSEHIMGVKAIKAAGVEDRIISKGSSLFRRLRDLAVESALLQQVTQLTIPPLGVLFVAVIFALSFRTDFISLAALPAIVYLIYRIFLYIQQLQANLQGINEIVPNLQSVLAQEDKAIVDHAVLSGKRPFVFKDALRFEKVLFAYESEQPVLHDVSFEIKRGSMVGLIGPSGSGKTTCVDLMLRLLTPAQGRITLDGVAIQEIIAKEWHDKVGYVSQDVFLMHDTIRNNIRFYINGISDEEIWEAARMAHIDEFIRESADELDTIVGERGVKLSAGQRQRLVIARALVRKPELLILDEATSALDNESEEYVKEAIRALKGRVTIIAIAHRLSTVMDSDILIALENGRIAEVGTPQELLKDKDSYFYKVNAILE